MNLLIGMSMCMHSMCMHARIMSLLTECACVHLCMCVSPGVRVYPCHLEVFFIFTACFAQAAAGIKISSSL